MRWRTADLLEQLAPQRRAALVFVDGYGHRRDYGFDEVATLSGQYAAALRAFGVEQNERVCVHLSMTAKRVFTLIALESLGASVVLGRDDARRATTIVSDRKCRAQIDAMRDRLSEDTRYVIIGEECEGWARLDTLAQVAAPFRASHAPDRAELDAARTDAQSALGTVASDVVWYAPETQDARWFDLAIVQPWLAGCTAIAHSAAFEPRERLDLIRELEATVLAQPAEHYRAQLALRDPARFKIPRLRRCFVLDREPGEELRRAWEGVFGLTLLPAAGAGTIPQ